MLSAEERRATSVSIVWNVATSEFAGRKIKNSDWESIIAGIGTVSGLPSVALNRIVDAELRYLQGGKVTIADVLMGKNVKW